MSERGCEFLHGVYNVSLDKVDTIPHIIPDVPFVEPSFNKDLFGFSVKLFLLQKCFKKIEKDPFE